MLFIMEKLQQIQDSTKEQMEQMFEQSEKKFQSQFSILSEEIQKLQTYEAKKEIIEVVKKEDLPLGQKLAEKQLFVRNPSAMQKDFAMQNPDVTFNLEKGHLVASEETDSPTAKEAEFNQSQSYLFQKASD